MMSGRTSNDPSRLRSLRAASASDPAFVELAIDTFLGSSRQLLGKIRAAIAAQDPRTTAEAAHPLSSSSAQLGMRGLSALAKELEKLGRSGSLDGGQALLTRLESEYRIGVEFLATQRRGGTGDS